MPPSARRPAIVAVDDEPAVLAAVARDLRRRFGEEYRIVRAPSGAEALETLNELRRRGDPVALLIADQRMPGMEGTEYLTQARTIFPDAKRVLLTAYADTDAAIAAINQASLDYYLLKPWDPPEEQLWPVVEDLLEDWKAGSALTVGGVRVIGHRFSKESHDLRDFLARNRIPGRFLDVERDGEARELLTVANVADDRLPVAMLEDGSVVERPTILELAERLGVTGTPSEDHYDLVIVGGGPGRPGGGCLRRVGGAQDGARRARGARRAGRAVQPHRELPRLPDRADRLGPGAPRDRPGAPARRGAAHRPRRGGAARRGRRAGRRAQRRRRAQRELRARRLRRLLPPARHARVPRADRRGHLLRRGDDRGALVPRPARRRHRRRELRGSGGGVLQRVRPPGDDARAAHARGLDVALPHRADRQAAEHRGPHRHHGDRRVGRRAPGGACASTGPTARRICRWTPASSSSARRPRTDWLRDVVARDERGFILAGLDAKEAGWPLPRDPYLLETTVPGVFVAGDVRARSIKRVASAVGEGSMSVSLVHQYLVDG